MNLKEKRLSELKKERDNWTDYIRYKLLEDKDYDDIAEAAEKVAEIEHEIYKLTKEISD